MHECSIIQATNVLFSSGFLHTKHLAPWLFSFISPHHWFDAKWKKCLAPLNINMQHLHCTLQFAKHPDIFYFIWSPVPGRPRFFRCSKLCFRPEEAWHRLWAGGLNLHRILITPSQNNVFKYIKSNAWGFKGNQFHWNRKTFWIKCVIQRYTCASLLTQSILVASLATFTIAKQRQV